MLERLFHYETSPGGESGGGGGSGAQGDPDPTPPGGTPDPQAGSGDETVPKAELEKVRREAAKHRTEKNTLQKRIEELEGASKTEMEKLTDRLTALEKDNKSEVEKNRSLRVQVLAGRVGIVEEAREDAARLLNWDQITDPDDEAQVEDALRNLTKSKTYLLGNVPGGADGGAGGGRGQEPVDMNARIRAAAGRS